MYRTCIHARNLPARFFSTKQRIYRMICISDRTTHWMICIFAGKSAEAVRSVRADLSGICGASTPAAYAKTSQNRQFRIHPRPIAAGCEIRSPNKKSCTVVCRICKMYQGCIIPLNAPARIFQHKAEHLPDDLHIGPYNALDFSHIRRRIRRSCAVSAGGFVRFLRYIPACCICENIAAATFSHSSVPEYRGM